MSLLQHASSTRLALPSVRRTVGRAAARLVLGFRCRPARLIEEEMPEWQLRDLGFRDGRSVTPWREGFD